MAREKYSAAGLSPSTVEAQPPSTKAANSAGNKEQCLYNRSMKQIEHKEKTWLVAVDEAGQRLDAWLHHMLPEFSRALLQRAIRDGKVLLDGDCGKPAHKLRGGERVSLHAPLQHPSLADKPEDIALNLVHTDQDLIVLNKPAGLVVHPGAGNREGTLLNALLFAFPELSELPRAGLVHRLDKNTSGLLVVARTPTAHTSLVQQLKQRLVSRLYLALCHGRITAPMRLDHPVGRNPHNRLKMAVTQGGKPALSLVTPLRLFTRTSLVEVRLHTGRTHQIRVHLNHAGFPLVGDPLYTVGGKTTTFHRQALHATRLSLSHPRTGESRSWSADMPEDMRGLVATLEGKTHA